MAGFETLIEGEAVAIVRDAIGEGGSAEEVAARAVGRILQIEKVKEAFAAWWREESYSDIFDGPDS